MEQLQRFSSVVFKSNSMKLNKGIETPGIMETIRREFAEVGDIDIALDNAQLLDAELFRATSFFRDQAGRLVVLDRGHKYNA
jgi:hypothetical protein